MKTSLLAIIAFIILPTSMIGQTKNQAKRSAPNSANSKIQAVDKNYHGYRFSVFKEYIKFQRGANTINKSSDEILIKLANYMNNRQQSKILIEGYASSAGSTAQSKQLSENRANNVKKALVEHYGINTSRILTNGIGNASTQLLEVTKTGDVALFYEIGYTEKDILTDNINNLGAQLFAEAFDIFVLDKPAKGTYRTQCSHCGGAGCSYCGNTGEEDRYDEDAGFLSGFSMGMKAAQQSSQQSNAPVQNGYSSIEYQEGKYEGFLKNGKPNGIGTYKWNNGNRYVGEWKNGQRHGRGTYMTKNGNIFVGAFVDGVLRGNAALSYANGDRCYAASTNMILNGKGTYIWRSGDKYEGEIANGVANGKGVKTYSNGDRYDGDFANGKLSGNGIYKWKNGDMYTGSFIDNDVTGEGKKIYANGDRFDGSIVKGLPSGKGIYKWKNGDVYDGIIKNGKLNGKGKLVKGNGEEYEGYFADSQLTSGTLKWPNGDIFEGKFKKDSNPYEGVYTFANGNKYKGTIINGKKSGLGTIYDASTKTSISGFFKNDILVERIGEKAQPEKTDTKGTVQEEQKKEVTRQGIEVGEGSYTWADGSRYEGHWRGWKPGGKGTFTWPNGDRYVGSFHSGIPAGLGTMYHVKDHTYEHGIWSNKNLLQLYEKGKWSGDYQKKK